MEECETEGEPLLTDGGIVPLTQLVGSAVQTRNKGHLGGGGHTCVLAQPCAEHMFDLTVEIPRISQNNLYIEDWAEPHLTSYITK